MAGAVPGAPSHRLSVVRPQRPALSPTVPLHGGPDEFSLGLRGPRDPASCRLLGSWNFRRAALRPVGCPGRSGVDELWFSGSEELAQRHWNLRPGICARFACRHSVREPAHHIGGNCSGNAIPDRSACRVFGLIRPLRPESFARGCWRGGLPRRVPTSPSSRRASALSRR